eukprot:4236683-Pleurochrysis_carterae.AAC.8
MPVTAQNTRPSICLCPDSGLLLTGCSSLRDELFQAFTNRLARNLCCHRHFCAPESIRNDFNSSKGTLSFFCLLRPATYYAFGTVYPSHFPCLPVVPDRLIGLKLVRIPSLRLSELQQ